MEYACLMEKLGEIDKLYMTNIFIFAANYLFWIIIGVAGVVFLLTKRTAKSSFLRISAIAFILSFLIGKLASSLYYDPRPFVVEHTQPLIPHAANNGFPSDHTLFAMTIAGIVFLYHKKVGLLLVVLAIIVGIARILAKVHSPVDIVSGAVIAVLAVYLSLVINSLIQKLFISKRRIITHE